MKVLKLGILLLLIIVLAACSSTKGENSSSSSNVSTEAINDGEQTKASESTELKVVDTQERVGNESFTSKKYDKDNFKVNNVYEQGDDVYVVFNTNDDNFDSSDEENGSAIFYISKASQGKWVYKDVPLVEAKDGAQYVDKITDLGNDAYDGWYDNTRFVFSENYVYFEQFGTIRRFQFDENGKLNNGEVVYQNSDTQNIQYISGSHHDGILINVVMDGKRKFLVLSNDSKDVTELQDKNGLVHFNSQSYSFFNSEQKVLFYNKDRQGVLNINADSGEPLYDTAGQDKMFHYSSDTYYSYLISKASGSVYFVGSTEPFIRVANFNDQLEQLGTDLIIDITINSFADANFIPETGELHIWSVVEFQHSPALNKYTIK